MNLNITSESVFRSAYTKGQFDLDPNRMIQLMFSLDKNLLRFIASWNEDMYRPLSGLVQNPLDVDAWKTGLDGSSIPITLDPALVVEWWNVKRLRPYTVKESLELMADLVLTIDAFFERIAQLVSPILKKYLARTFVSLLDTPSNYSARSLVRYSEFNKELTYVPFLNLALTPPTDFLSLDDTPGSFVDGRVATLNAGATALEFQPPGYTRRGAVTQVATDFDTANLFRGYEVLVCDSAVGDIMIDLNPPSSFLDMVVSIVVPTFVNSIELGPAGSTYEGSAGTVEIFDSPFLIAYDPLTNDYKQIGEHI